MISFLNICQSSTILELPKGYLINRQMQWYGRESCNNSRFTAFVVIEVSTNTDDLLGCMEVSDFCMRKTPYEVHGILTGFMASSCVIISAIANEVRSS